MDCKELLKDIGKGAARGATVGILAGAPAGAIGLHQVCNLLPPSLSCDSILSAEGPAASGAGAGVGFVVGALVGGVVGAGEHFLGWMFCRKAANSDARPRSASISRTI